MRMTSQERYCLEFHNAWCTCGELPWITDEEDKVIECHAMGCPARGTHYAQNPSTGAPFYLCGKHMNDHALGFGFELDTHIRLAGDEDPKSAAPLLTEPAPAVILETSTATAEEAHMAYNSALSALTNARDEAQEAIDEIEERLSELNDAREQLGDFIDSLAGAIAALEEVDGFSVSVDVDSISVDVSVYL